MQFNQLQRNHPNKKSRQVGRGSKRGKTSGRGGKGQTARAGHKGRPELRDFIKRLPKLRGRGKNSNKSIEDKPAILNLEIIEAAFGNGESVTPETLITKGLIKKEGGNTPQVKLLGDGEFSKKISVAGCLVSASAKIKIEKAGGSIAA